MRFVLVAFLLTAPAFSQRTIPVHNAQVRVLSVVDKPTGRKGALHDHKMDRVMIYLDEGAQRLTYQDGRVVNRAVKPGMVVWDPANGGMHQSENPGTTECRIIEIELLADPKPFTPPALDPVKVFPKGYKIELENDRVRVLRAKFDAHTKIPLHEHSLNRVTVFLQPQSLRVAAEDGSATVMTPAQGEVRWGTPARHREENLGDGTFEVLAVELK